MQISEIMTDKVITVSQDEPVSTAARLLKRHNIGALPVCDEQGRLRGIVTDRDIVLRCVAAEVDPRDMRISEIMSRGIATASPRDDVGSAADVMSKGQVRRLPIVENGRVIGMVALGDMARSCVCNMEAAEALSDISANIKRK